MSIAHEDYRYDESGLSNVVLVGLEVRHCTCGETQPVIHNIEGLHRAIARRIVEQVSRLSGEQVRYLRTYLGWRAIDFAKIMGVTKECISRWENDRDVIGGTADRALRLLVQLQKPVSDYSPERITGLLENICENGESFLLRLERRPGVGWSEDPVAAPAAPPSAIGFPARAVVYVLVFEGQAAGAGAQRLMQVCDGYVQLRPGCWIVSSDLPAVELRDFVGDGIDVHVLVGRLNRGWAAKGFGQAANWLQRADDAF